MGRTRENVASGASLFLTYASDWDGYLFLAFPAVGIRDCRTTIGGTGRGDWIGIRRWSRICDTRRPADCHARRWVNRATCRNGSKACRRNTVTGRYNHRRIDAGTLLSEMAHTPIIALPLLHPLKTLASGKRGNRYQSERKCVNSHDTPKQFLVDVAQTNCGSMDSA